MAKSKSHIAIIGAGQLGSRHLQGLVKINQELDITVIEPNSDALDVAKKRYNEMPLNPRVHSISYFESINDIDFDIDASIIATNANIRRNVIESLLNRVSVKYLILEKVAFQSNQDFEFVIQLLGKKNVKAWVNCPRRMVPFFHELREKIIHKEKITISVKGSNWGLASNTIHMLDLLAFLTGQKEITINAADLVRKIYQSKRQGFIELRGRLIARTVRGDILDILDDREAEIPLLMCVETDEQKIEIHSLEGLCRISQKNSEKQSAEQSFHMPLQSELTPKLTEQILETGTSDLTSLEESFLLHKPMLNAFNTHLSSVHGRPFIVCPIT